jgi:hypothetical protein
MRCQICLRQQAVFNDVSSQLASKRIDVPTWWYLWYLNWFIPAKFGGCDKSRIHPDEAGWGGVDCHTEECSSIPPLGMQCTAHQALYGTIITCKESPTFSLIFSRYQPCDFLIPVPDPFLACSDSRRQKPLFNNFKSRFPSYFSLPYLLQ